MAATEQATITYDLKNIRDDIEDIINNPTKDSIEKDNKFQYKQWLHNGKRACCRLWPGRPYNPLLGTFFWLHHHARLPGQ